MNIRRRVLCLLASAPALLFACLTAPQAWGQVTSPNGSYGVLINQWKDPNSSNNSAVLGVLNFDGAGNISGSYTLFSTKNGKASGTWTGTYSGNADGSNTVNLTLDVGGTIVAAMAITDGGTGLQILVTGGSLLKSGQVLSGSGRIQSAQGTVPAGSYGYLLNQWQDSANGPVGILGVINLDGAGNESGTYNIVGEPNLPPFNGTFAGTYSVNPDSTGTAIINLDFGITSTMAVVITDGGSGILFLQTGATGNSPPAVVSGIARMQ